MSTVHEIEDAIRKLPEGDLAALRAWFAEFDAAVWDRQFERDVADGRLDALAGRTAGRPHATRSIAFEQVALKHHPRQIADALNRFANEPARREELPTWPPVLPAAPLGAATRPAT
jgi:hypothetical protein